ncbi:MAG: response regulator, partial [Nitrospinota bacterium]
SDALVRLDGGEFDVVITDIEMPDKDGFTFTHELKVDKAFRHVPIIIASSLDKNKFRERAKEVGADAYIVKKDFHRGGVSELVKTLIHQNSLK